MNTIRWLGMFLIGGAAAFVGFSAALRVRQTTMQLRQLLDALEVMRCELRFTMTPLPRLCQVVVQTAHGTVKTLFTHLQGCLENSDSPEQAMRNAIARTKRLTLPDEILFSLLELGQTLGKFDLDGQISMLEMSQKRIRLCLERYEKDQAQRCRSYQTLGLCAGAALILLMI